MVKDWAPKPIKELANIVSGGTPSTTVAEYWDGSIVWIAPTDITRKKSKYLSSSERKITESGLANSGAILLPTGALLLCTRATIGELSIAAQPLATNQGFKNLICFDGIDNQWLYYAMQLMKPKMIEQASGSTFLEISKTALGNIEILTPPDKPEQIAIATALSDADALIDALEQSIAKKRQIKQGAMQELLTGKRRLPGFAGEWSVKQLGDVGQIKSGGTPSTLRADFWDGEIPWCTPSDLTNLTCSKLLTQTSRSISQYGLKFSSAEIIPKRSLIMTTRATIGECAINSVPMTTNQGFKNIVPFADVNVDFLYYLMSTQKNRLVSLCGGSTFLEMGKTQLLSFEILMPDYNEQTAIAAVLSDMDDEITALEAKLAKARQIKIGMMQELLTGRIRLV